MVVIIIMGVCGCGKTTIGEALAKEMSLEFADADDFHSWKNKAKMSQSIPLTDEDRHPWLLSLHERIRSWCCRGEPGVMACSALKETYRDTLLHGAGERVHKNKHGVTSGSAAADDNKAAEEHRENVATITGEATRSNGCSDVVFVYLRGSRELLLSRMSTRRGHYMPATLLDSQLATLEEPAADRRHLVVDIDDESSVQKILENIKTFLNI